MDAEGTATFTYDNANELTGVYENGTQVESYSYDLNGNRTGTGYTTTVRTRWPPRRARPTPTTMPAT